ncbi:MAG: hypothetical protein WA964_19825 [Ilumatobacter sp.]|uniref:hypothetical protein n=1 Tax=Ilumatobacter sp. TaxID=1967498 RepID=UPI003C731310
MNRSTINSRATARTRRRLGSAALAGAAALGVLVVAPSLSSAIGAGSVVELQVAGEGAVPDDASAAVLNIGAARASANGYVVAWPCGEDRPEAASVNYRPGAATSNSTVVALGDDGSVCLWSSASADLVVDVNAAYPAGSELVSFTPTRLLDTRDDEPVVPPTPPGPTPPGNGRFATLPPGSALPSAAQCAARVRPAAENRPENAVANATSGTGANDRYPRVDGDFTGTTDEILQWAACKWGIDEDIVRAQVVRESYWKQSTLGDFNGDPSTCSPYFGIGNYPPQYTGDSQHNGQCPESFGLAQVRWLYHQEGFEDANSIGSSAYNVDYTYAVWRDCYEGNLTWLNDVEGRGDYRAGDVEGCLGVWFAGRWYTAGAVEYISVVRGHLADRPWERADF